MKAANDDWYDSPLTNQQYIDLLLEYVKDFPEQKWKAQIVINKLGGVKC